jgi:hypothetical protein
VGDEYVEINGGYYHYACVSDNYTVNEILALLKVDVREAEDNYE